MAFWGFGYKLQEKKCTVLSYDLSPGTNCPWPGVCYDNYCVSVDVLFYGPAIGEEHKTYVFMGYGGDPYNCWTSDSADKIQADLSKQYPISSNQTCYSTTDDWGPNSVYFMPLKIEDTLLYTAITFFTISAVTLGGAIVVWLIRCRRNEVNEVNEVYEEIN